MKLVIQLLLFHIQDITVFISPLYPVEQSGQKMGSIWRDEMGVKNKQPMQKLVVNCGRTDNSSMKKTSHTEPHSCRGHD